MNSFVYFAELVPASKFAETETGFVVQFPDLPEAITQGENESDALVNATDALEEAIMSRMERNDDIPVAAFRKGHGVPVPTQTALKAALYMVTRGERGAQVALASRLGKDEKEVRRLLDPRHRSRTKSLEQALRGFGKQVTVSLEDVA